MLVRPKPQINLFNLNTRRGTALRRRLNFLPNFLQHGICQNDVINCPTSVVSWTSGVSPSASGMVAPSNHGYVQFSSQFSSPKKSTINRHHQNKMKVMTRAATSYHITGGTHGSIISLQTGSISHIFLHQVLSAKEKC